MPRKYLAALKKSAFSGEIRTDYAARLAVATDNSVYQVVPQAVLLPKTIQDIAIVLQLAQRYEHIQFSPRGGGTGTNGQSLTSGIMIDCSAFMREILEINLEENWVKVQPGVVLDQLNGFLKAHDRCFAVQISPSNRATLGGMVNTDACGNGSSTVGRTSDYVIDLTCIMSNGRIIHTSQPDSLHEKLFELIAPQKRLIHEKFIDRPRNLNGYNLLNTLQDNINLNYLLSGSEGTLAIVGEIKLKINPIPKFKKLILIKYNNFDEALNLSIPKYVFCDSVIIEAIDEKLLDLAREDAMYFQIKDMIDGDVKSGAINLVEMSGNEEDKLNLAMKAVCEQEKNAIGFYFAKNTAEIKLLWELRKKSVGLISKKQQGTRRPIPFIEDTAVPPEKLPEYIHEFKKLLDQHNLIYGMYGHVDAGCIHVRPALDLKQSEDEILFNTLSNQIAALVEKFDGVMWGEHGMGYRSHYAKKFFGYKLYFLIQQIKTLFDPENRLNPGKIAVPLDVNDNLVQIMDSLRATQDKQIPEATRDEFPNVMSCNGNGACFNFSTQDAMCPSYKVTKDRVHSPKGRASLMREWLRLRSIKKTGTFSKEVYAAMNGCLSCKACAFQCPLNVDVPEFKAKFLEIYHRRYLRPVRDYFIAATEKIAVIQAKYPRISNGLLKNKLIRYFVKKIIKMVDVPVVSQINFKQELKNRSVPVLDLSRQHSENSVILLQDAFTSFYEPALVLKVYDFLVQLGMTVYVLPFFPNGKSLHVKGFLKRFSKTANKNITYLREVAKSGIPMIGIDPSITLTYRDEYKKLLGNFELGFHVKLLQEWLIDKTALFPKTEMQEYYLLSHCTEKTACVAAEKQWQEIFSACGLKLTPLSAGCCGMAGSYGHELEHLENSKQLFAMDWEQYLRNNNRILATGYSCRSQAKRLSGMRLPHPVEVLIERKI